MIVIKMRNRPERNTDHHHPYDQRAQKCFSLPGSTGKEFRRPSQARNQRKQIVFSAHCITPPVLPGYF
jgi:hypothetical protein